MQEIQDLADQTGAAGQRETPRTLNFSVPLVFNGRVLGDVMIEIIPGEPASFETVSLRSELIPLLNDRGIDKLDQTISGRQYISGTELSEAGFQISFDESRLEVAVTFIAGEYRPVSSLGREDYESAQQTLPSIQPAEFSAYLNLNTNFDYSSQEGLLTPEIFLLGAARFKDVVVELDGAFTEQFGDGYRFYRRSLRAIYDQPEHDRRFTAGDLRLTTIPLLQTPFVGGVAVEKRRQIFNPFQPVSRLGGQEVFLDSRSTVDVLINGAQYQTFQLDAGRYDLANLPLQAGSNNVELRIRDSAGRQQIVDLNYFFEPLGLPAGEEEYALSAGFIARDLNFEPEYTGDPVAVGYYRRALSENLILGGAFQVSQDTQTFAAEASFVPQVIPGAFDVQVATSTGAGTGLAARASYRLRSGDSFANRKQLSLTIDYESASFRSVGEIFQTNFDLLNLTASYTQGFSERTFASAGASYTRRGGGQTDRSQIFVDVAHRLDDRLRLTAGVEYGDDGFSRQKFGARLGVVMLFGGRNRLNADYRSRTATTRATFSRGSEDRVGSFGYDIGFNDSRGSTGVDANVDYVSNRFDARASVFSEGNGFGNITNSQRARLQVGTSIAFADGVFGIGRPISDSFAVVAPHSSLKDRNVISGRNLSRNDYYARSGLFGGAVQADLSSYTVQDIQYDVDGLNPGYDIGDGLARVDPPFRSGYKIVVGNDRFVSTLGTLFLGDKPAKLVSGTITAIDDEGFEPLPFFTNSVGRFGAIGLAPGKNYLVSIPALEREFTIAVPADNTGLYRLGEVVIPAVSD
ncbi:hypothetical protein FGU71_05090 [Erythrobacter insulae]|uniref:Fimbrial biogenesis outer membrane usher protein n=1 Tax=Erythrobacter insulae TaxID=2584124 RepID=A0A547PAW5_9SPHN|nr:fimbria/pilus outer membrane usher protein [Erythrobacter insulae]TRD11283.1 hypothetical protein FGU71_05090 [Erythrobacter insulae]